MLVSAERSDPIQALAGCVDALAAEDLAAVPDSDLSESLQILRRQIDRLEAEFCRRLRRFDRLRGYAAEGAATLVAWLRSLGRLSAGAAYERAQTARLLEAHPAVEQAWRAGEISQQHAAVLATSVAEVGSEAFRPVENSLLEAARRLDPGRLRLVTRHLRYCVDPDGALDADNARHQRRRVDLSQTLDGVFVLDGLLDAEGGELLRTAINALDVPLPGDGRSPGQRRADALVELATRHLHGGQLPATHGQRPHLLVTLPAASLDGGQGAPPAQLGAAGPVSAVAAQRLACDASVREVQLDASGTATQAGAARRTIPSALRAALAVRDQGCRFPTCDRLLEWTDAHHIRYRRHGGPTTLDNLVMLCRTHHRFVHEGRWGLAWGKDGALVAVPP